ncbi:hypothetical protein M0R89_19260 (plasmid) [Halorussus limi]|uniref:Uncharacterized protein n=1 Tax=Halorussus limi TaxID=2938695 RepID=A0A8U0I0G1_9EURY|nr:hypothetical protein [Halorussus limi]UPV76304.1 hypothetical protein M0R89_19260 [Halorussus limi]
MTDSDEAGRTSGWMNRRTMLKNAAAAGLVGAGLTGTASAAEWTEMTLCASGSETFSYRVEVSGAVKRGGTYQSDSWDEVGDDYVEGAVSQKRCDSFLFQGEITSHELEGPGQLKVDGEVVAESSGDGGDVGDEKREVTFCAAGDETFSYRVEVTGELMRGGSYQSDSSDEVGDDYAEGATAGGRCDSFIWTGEIADLQVDGPGTVKVDGEVVEDTTGNGDGSDGGDSGDGGSLPKMVTISSPDTDEQMNYVIEVTGDFRKLEPNEDGGAAVDLVSQAGDRVRVNGTVGKGNDKFAFSGDLIEVDIPSGVVVEVTDR